MSEQKVVRTSSVLIEGRRIDVDLDYYKYSPTRGWSDRVMSIPDITKRKVVIIEVVYDYLTQYGKKKYAPYFDRLVLAAFARNHVKKHSLRTNNGREPFTLRRCSYDLRHTLDALARSSEYDEHEKSKERARTRGNQQPRVYRKHDPSKESSAKAKADPHYSRRKFFRNTTDMAYLGIDDVDEFMRECMKPPERPESVRLQERQERQTRRPARGERSIRVDRDADIEYDDDDVIEVERETNILPATQGDLVEGDIFDVWSALSLIVKEAISSVKRSGDSRRIRALKKALRLVRPLMSRLEDSIFSIDGED